MTRVAAAVVLLALLGVAGCGEESEHPRGQVAHAEETDLVGQYEYEGPPVRGLPGVSDEVLVRVRARMWLREDRSGMIQARFTHSVRGDVTRVTSEVGKGRWEVDQGRFSWRDLGFGLSIGSAPAPFAPTWTIARLRPSGIGLVGKSHVYRRVTAHTGYKLQLTASGQSTLTVRVPPERLSSVFLRLLGPVGNPGYLILETPVKRLRRNEQVPRVAWNVHYLNDVSAERARRFVSEHQDLLTSRSILSLGFAKGGTDEVLLRTNDHILVYTTSPGPYQQILRDLTIEERPTIEPYGHVFAAAPDGPSEAVASVLEEMAHEGLFFGERREAELAEGDG